MNKPRIILSKSIKLKSNQYHRLNDDLKQIHDMWDQVEQQINDPNSVYLLKRQNQKAKKSMKRRSTTYSRPIRVFVSSTFTDFFSEREILVKQFFPELREWCLKRNLDLIECDLRWGVPADSTSDNTILTCLRELDRCYEENEGQPFFIGLLGEKYGWVPDVSKLSPELVDEYNWLPGSSITFMEYLHGALRSKNGNACFFIRSKESLDGLPPEYNDKFFETVPMSKIQLQVEKEKLRANYQKQVVEYSAKFDGFDETTGRKRPKLSGLEDFGQKVISFLKNAIIRTYPDVSEIVVDQDHDSAQDYEHIIEDENHLQDLYINEKTNFFFGFDKEMMSIQDVILRDKVSQDVFQTVEVQEETLVFSPVNDQSIRHILIFGESGSGKSAFLANLFELLFEKNITVFSHFPDASVRAGEMSMMYARFVTMFSKLLDIPNTKIQLMGSVDSSRDIYMDILSKIGPGLPSAGRKVVILDNLENMGSNIFLEEQDQSLVDPLFIISMPKSHKLIKNIAPEGTKFLCLDLEYFDHKSIKDFVDAYLAKYNKKLDSKQINLILAKADQTESKRISPLWLSYICNELRIFGEFTTVTKKIENFPIDKSELLVQIINRINSDFQENIVIDLLCLICSSYHGILESKVIEIIQRLGHSSLNRLTWSQISVSLRNFIYSVTSRRCRVLRFKENLVARVVYQSIMGQRDASRTIEFYRDKIIEFYSELSDKQLKDLALFERLELLKLRVRMKEMVHLIKSEPSTDSPGFRSAYLNRARCMQMPVNIKTHQVGAFNLKMCTTCSMFRPEGSKFWSYKDMCFVCGTHLYGQEKSLAVRCIQHGMMDKSNQYFYECCVCKKMFGRATDNTPFGSKDAKLCMGCGTGTCCMFRFD